MDWWKNRNSTDLWHKLKNPNNQKFYIIYAVLRKPNTLDATGGKIAAPLVRDISIVLLQILK